jgi:diacylglycerol kinase (ATP)
MRVAIIINPISGPGPVEQNGAARLAQARRLIGDLCRPPIEADASVTTGPGHAADLARGYVSRGFDVVVAWGGDGTINEVAGPVIGSPAALGIIPSGSGNGLARSLVLPRDPAEALTGAVSGRASAIDVGYLGGRHFLNIAGIGFDAAVAADFNAGGKRGVMSYVSRVLRTIRHYHAEVYRLRLDAEARDGQYFLVAFANGREYGNRFVLAPKADAADGWLDVVLVETGSPARQIWRTRRMLLASDRPAEGIIRTRVRAATIGGACLRCHVDGEAFSAEETVEVRLAPRALRIIGATDERQKA